MKLVSFRVVGFRSTYKVHKSNFRSHLAYHANYWKSLTSLTVSVYRAYLLYLISTVKILELNPSQ